MANKKTNKISGVEIVDYSEKSFAIIGDTKPIKDSLKALGGRFNALLTCGAGWIFSNKAREGVESFIATGNVTKYGKRPNKRQSVVK